MSRIWAGAFSGVIFGIVAMTMMIPLKFEDRTAAFAGAFLNRFAIGFTIGISSLPVPGWLHGMIIGLLISGPDAVITKAYVPILGMGCLGGALIGWILSA